MGSEQFVTEKLLNLCELIVDCPHSTPKWTDSGFIVLRNQNIRNGVLDLTSPSFTDESGYKSRIKRAIPQAGDIVITREAPMGEVCIIPEGLQCCLGQRQVLLRPKKNISNEYLFWALQSPFVKHQISWNEGTGTTVSNIRIPVLKDFDIPRWFDAEPKIAAQLSTIDNKITLNRQINQTLEQMARTLFKSWFVDFDPVIDNALDAGNAIPDELQARAEQRQALRNAAIQQGDASATPAGNAKPLPDNIRQLFPNEFEESELDWVPKGWGVTRLENILELAYGKALTKNDRVDGDYPVYGSGGINGYHNEYLVKGPGVIVGRKGTVGSLYWEESSFFAIDTVFYVKPKRGYSLDYCFYLLQTLGLESMNTDAAVPGLNRNNAYRLPCLIPTHEIRDLLGKFLKNNRSKMDACTKQSGVLAEIRDSLLPKLISGELKLRGGE